MKFRIGITLWLLVTQFLLHAEATSDIPNLLKPQQNSQITLRIPDYYYLKMPILPPSLTLAIDFLVSEQVPFRLFYNYTAFKQWSIVSRPPHFTQNDAVWLVFVSVQSQAEVVHLYKVLESCTLGINFGFSATIHKDFIQLIVDESVVAGPWDKACHFDIDRSNVPLYFVMMSWSGTHFRSHDVLFLRETCGCDDGSPFSVIKNFIPKLDELNGMEGILKEIRLGKIDFRGRRVTIYPSRRIYGSWESIWKHFFLPF